MLEEFSIASGGYKQHMKARSILPVCRTPMALAACAFLIAAVPAHAHVPGLEGDSEGAAPIGGPEVSRATYGYLAPGEDVDEYVFTAGESVSRTIGIIVPAYAEHANFRPTLVVVPEDDDPVTIEDPGAEERRREFEPFSLAYFWWGGESEVEFVEGVSYTLRVEPGPGDASGRYVIVFAGPERFEAADIGATLGQLPVIWFGAYGGAPLRWNWLALIPFAIGVALFGGLVLLLARLLRSERPR